MIFGYGSFQGGLIIHRRILGISIFQGNVQRHVRGIFRGLIFQGKMGVWIPVQDYKSLCPMVMI